ncbi:MAG: hypothetical protein HKN21_11625 [Candidatus Eisenbacteria bacterium]|uniref:Exonuclease domain-containing protein n=1 Tax=Eiseniibacteriota bacterium TaxID=2212470 RepID=A0A7Y2H335_UNCEI|nr:hypothetical protein [Candidatus Eisenbacteria bacterium]
MSSRRSANHYLWFDTEYSTLDLENAKLLQVAMLVTDAKLKRLHPPEEDVNVFIRFDGTPAAWVQENLAPLVETCKSDQAISVEESDTALAEYIDKYFGAPSKEIRLRPMLAGNSIHADWFLVRRFLPKLMDRVHYRLLDVTTVKMEWLRWFKGSSFDKENPVQVRRYFPGALISQDLGPHDAYYDIQASVAELSFYRSGLTKVVPQKANT